MNDTRYKNAELHKWLSRLDMSIDAVKDFYNPELALNLEARITNAYDNIRAIYRINQHDIADILKSCPDPYAIHDTIPLCDKCPNYTMGPEGRPTCKVTWRALE